MQIDVLVVTGLWAATSTWAKLWKSLQVQQAIGAVAESGLRSQWSRSWKPLLRDHRFVLSAFAENGL